MNSDSVTCEICEKVFTKKKNLYAHLRNVHGLENVSGNLLCPLCNSARYRHFSELRQHLAVGHGIMIVREELSFENKTEFLQWKEHIENDEKCSYVLQRTVTLCDERKKSYYCCNRSGPCLSQSSGLRATKAQGSCKIGAHCPSSLEVTEQNNICVIYFKTHVGHKHELKHLTLSETERKELARKLSEGISIGKCLDDVRNSLTDTIERIHLLTRKDLINIGNAHGLFKSEQLHSNDATSVRLWVNKMHEMGESSSVIFFKAQDEAADPLELQDFCIIIMTPAQREMLCKFGNNKICIDSTHGTNNYDFQLTTIVVVDEFGSGFPAAFCLSNRVDTVQMELFFTKVQEKTTSITPDVFMTDDAPAFFNAWKKVMGPPKKQLLCTWHVDRNWRQGLNKIKSKEKQVAVYKFARTLLEEMDSTKFHLLLETFLKELEDDDDTKAFHQYFLTYAARCELWAFCYRLHAGINTNMYLEALHKVIKYAYMQGRKCKRVDTCITHLLKLVKDRIFCRFISLIKGSNSIKITEIHDRHKKSISIGPANIKQLSKFEWEVRSQEISSVLYNVQKTESVCQQQCLIKCNFCNICIHQYLCTCIDYQVKINMCKHIHAVHQIMLETSAPHSCNKKTEEVVIGEIEESDSFKNLISMNNSSPDPALKIKLNHIMNLLNTKTLNSNTGKRVNKHLDDIISLINDDGVNNGHFQEKLVNQQQKIEPQSRFFSTKKRRITVNPIEKPSSQYKHEITESTCSGNYMPIINIHNTFDHTYSKINI